MDSDLLSPREREVLDLVGEHLTHEEIGRRLYISVRTVESHVASLRRKLALPDHRALVRHAVQARAATAVRAALPAPPTSFVGRQAELSALQATLGLARLVSAVGPGGVGKTRLALAAATGLASVYSGGVRWVDLVPVGEAARLADAVAQACDAEVSSRRGPVEALIATLRARPVLLVLDNAEHLINAVALLTEQLLSSCPQLTVLVTSRARLAQPSERVFPVAGLDPAGDATDLFVERAVAAGVPSPTEDERLRIGAVCQTIGGLALAIELAAVRMPTLGLDGVERALLDQPNLLVGGSRLHPRHRSMNETIDWSVTLIDPDAAIVLRRLGVLVSSFDSEAAVAVAAFASLSADDVRAGLIQLAEHNLLDTTPTRRGLTYRLLEPVRQYGLARMSVDDRQAFEQHASWCLHGVEAALSADGADDYRAIDDEARAALAWAAGRDDPPPVASMLARRFGLLLYRHGVIREAQARLEQAAGLTRDGALAAADLARAAAVAKCRVSGAEALRLELAAADRAPTEPGRAQALARAAELLNRFPGMFAEPDAAQADVLLQHADIFADGDPHATAAIAVARAGYAAASATFSIVTSRAALDAARATQDPVLVSAALDALIGATVIAGDIAEAHQLAQQRLSGLPAWDDDPAVGLEVKDALHVATFCALGAGDLRTALAMAHRQHDLQFLRERRDLADDELMAPAALAGDWEIVVGAGERFEADWTAAGSPVAAGRGLAPAAVALAYGLQGQLEARRHWIRIFARVRGVVEADAAAGSGYGELFDAMVRLHDDDPHAALDTLADNPNPGLYTHVFAQWAAAVKAEAAVLSGAPDTEALLARAVVAGARNPIAAAIARRAAALHAGDRDHVDAVANEFLAAGSAYQHDRTRRLAERMSSASR